MCDNQLTRLEPCGVSPPWMVTPMTPCQSPQLYCPPPIDVPCRPCAEPPVIPMVSIIEPPNCCPMPCCPTSPCTGNPCLPNGCTSKPIIPMRPVLPYGCVCAQPYSGQSFGCRTCIR